MNRGIFGKLQSLAGRPEALAATTQYLREKLYFLRKKEAVLICFKSYAADSIGGLMKEAVLCCGATPICIEEDYRWKTILRIAFEQRVTTVIAPPLVILGLAKLAKFNATPLNIRNAVTAGYPCFDWTIDGIVESLDCKSWGCFDPGMDAVVAGFSCGKSRGVHLRQDVYGVEILGEGGRPPAAGVTGEMVIYPREDPTLRYAFGERARMELSACACGCREPRLMEIQPGSNMDPDILELYQKLHSWFSVLDCKLMKGHFGLEMEIVVFPGLKLPKLPSSAKLVIRPWNPEADIPFDCMTIPENYEIPGESN